MKLRFSVSTLLTTVLLLASLAALWLKWDPWFPRFRIEEPESLTVHAPELSSDGQWILYLVGDASTQKAEWVLWNVDARTSQRYEAGTSKPFTVPAVLAPQQLRLARWQIPTPPHFMQDIYNLRTNSVERLPWFHDGLAHSSGSASIFLLPRGKVPRMLNPQTGEDRALPFLSDMNRYNSISRVSVDTASHRILCDDTFFDLNSGAKIATLHPSERAQIFSPDGSLLLLSAEDATRLYDAETGELLQIMEYSENFIFNKDASCLLLADREYLSVYSLKPTVERLWMRRVFGNNPFQVEGDGNIWIDYDELGETREPWRTRDRPYRTSLECIDWKTGKILADLKNLDADFRSWTSRIYNGVLRISFGGGYLLWNRQTGFHEIKLGDVAFESADRSRLFVHSNVDTDTPAYVADAEGVPLWSFPPKVYLTSDFGEKSGRFLTGYGTQWTLWERRRDEHLWGIVVLPEFWAVVGCFGLCIANVVHIRRRRETASAAQ